MLKKDSKQALSKIAGIIHGCLRNGDVLVSYGGEEFVVLLFGITEEYSIGVAERIRQNIESSPIYNKELGINVSVTISIGIRYVDKQKISAESLL